MDKLSAGRNRINLVEYISKPDGETLQAIFTRNLVEELNRSTNKCMQEYKALIKNKSNTSKYVYRFHAKGKKFKKPSASGKLTIMSTITEQKSMENLINEGMQVFSDFSKTNVINLKSKHYQKTKFTETSQKKEKKTETSQSKEKKTETSQSKEKKTETSQSKEKKMETNQTKVKKSEEITDIPQQRLKMKLRISENASTKKPFYATRRSK